MAGDGVGDGIAAPAHRTWLDAERDRLFEFGAGAVRPGGFGWLDSSGVVDASRPLELWITCRMTHVFALAKLVGWPGAEALVDHGVQALRTGFKDEQNGGWFTSIGKDGPVDANKAAYPHSFVILAASSAKAAGHPEAEALLSDALEVNERWFWREEDGMVVDAWDRTFKTLDPYRGVNANMHTVEAYLAAADATGDAIWRERARRISERVLGWAGGNQWRIPEHFDEAWQPLLEYNRDQPNDQFKPYGATIGHGMEWSRLVLDLTAAIGDEALVEGSKALFERATEDGWAADGADGFVYTTDWNGKPVVRTRLHWVVNEATNAAAALYAVTGEQRYDDLYRQWWEYADRYLIDRANGSWRSELDPQNRPSATVWDGKPDVYHSVQATLAPQLPLAPVFAFALAQRQ